MEAPLHFFSLTKISVLAEWLL